MGQGQSGEPIFIGVKYCQLGVGVNPNFEAAMLVLSKILIKIEGKGYFTH